jgi:hypothetical protein
MEMEGKGRERNGREEGGITHRLVLSAVASSESRGGSRGRG